MKRLGLYIHIPFCKSKCRYCDFVSYPGKETLIDNYIEAVIHEATLYRSYLKERNVDTLFIGGGTPSLLSPRQITRLFSGLQNSCLFSLSEGTIEANPETLDEQKLRAYSEHGINRLSMGLQSHDDEILKAIGRRHTFGGFAFAYEKAAKYFRNINVDIIFGLPGQSTQNFISTLENVLGFSPKHISAYSLKLEQGTSLAEEFAGADEDTDREMYHSAAEILYANGYEHYETSNFACTGYECEHNIKYWTGAEYLGLGAAAHSYTVNLSHKRHCNIESLEEYMDKVSLGVKPVKEETELTDADIITEYIMLRLRLKRGINFGDFESRFGFSFSESFRQQIETTKKAGLIVQQESGIYPTLYGFDLQNTLISEFIK